MASHQNGAALAPLALPSFGVPVLLEPPIQIPSSRVLMADRVGVPKLAAVNGNTSNPYGFEKTELLIERDQEKG